MKYERFARYQSFNAQGAKDYLSWVLAGRAADYYFFLMRLDNFDYVQIMWFMEQRFAPPQRPHETTFLSFQDARQKHGESLCDWADRVHHLALGAFETVAHAGMTERDIEDMLYKFCDGCLDREAGHHAFKRRPISLDQAITFIQKFQFSYAGMCGLRDSGRPSDLHPFRASSHSDPEYLSKFCKERCRKSYTSDDNRQDWEYAPAGTRDTPRVTYDMPSSPSRHCSTLSSEDEMELLQSFKSGFVDRTQQMMANNLTKCASKFDDKVSISSRCQGGQARGPQLSKPAGYTSNHGCDETPCQEELHSTQSAHSDETKNDHGSGPVPL
ncbi:hypothetical protein PoB_004012600 [Plakobranchus ocellatus]|uniref:Uncharacterized protein n=1 Tax=Plakobranchus ocellatus TaxID=259542 RepID=A0AAV4B475_9GAST|nr:hypothetical protein PoB_004012600 [Plakobranchus ocellatus]